MGTLSLVLSTPLTVCLVVLGKHVPQFEFLEVLFGNDPVLETHARMYQPLAAIPTRLRIMLKRCWRKNISSISTRRLASCFAHWRTGS